MLRRTKSANLFPREADFTDTSALRFCLAPTKSQVLLLLLLLFASSLSIMASKHRTAESQGI
jgi:hypothetical protein